MLAKRIIPCLDIKDGRIVKGVNFKNLRDAGDPVELAVKYVNEGADELIFLDISATEQKRKTLTQLVYKIALRIDIPFTVGGGIRSLEDADAVLENGADKVSINSSAIEKPELINVISEKYGSQCVVVAIDAKKISTNKWEVFTHGGRNKTGIDAVEFSKKVEKSGAGEILLTSMDRDGTKSGYDIELLKMVTKNTNIPVIASGGVGTLDHLYDGITTGGASAVLAASIFHYGEHSIKDVKEYLNSKKVPVRLQNV